MIDRSEFGGSGIPKEGPGASPETMRLSVVGGAVGRLSIAEQQIQAAGGVA